MIKNHISCNQWYFILTVSKRSTCLSASFSFLPTFLCPEGKNLVKIDLMDWDGQRNYAFYENFKITNEAVR